MDDYKQGDKVRLTTSRAAPDRQFEGSTSQHGKATGTVTRVYEEQGNAVCDLAFSDGTTQTGVALTHIEPAENRAA